MPHEKTRKIRKKVAKKRKAAQAEAARKERRRIEKKRRVKRKATAPVRKARRVGGELKEAGAEVRETGVEAGKLVKAKTPGVTSFRRRKTETKTKKQASSADAAQVTDRQQKILFAQQLRAQGLTLDAIAAEVNMSPSWVSKNTAAPRQQTSGQPTQQVERDSGGFLDDLTGTFESIEDSVFGGGSSGGGRGSEKSIDDAIADIDDDLGFEDGDFDIDLDGID